MFHRGYAASRTRRRARSLDLVVERLTSDAENPRCAVDLLLLPEALENFPANDEYKAASHFLRSRGSLPFTSSFPSVKIRVHPRSSVVKIRANSWNSCRTPFWLRLSRAGCIRGCNCRFQGKISGNYS